MNSQVEQVKAAKSRLRRLELFLMGEDHLDGALFGDDHPDHIGRFWWRKEARETFAEVREALASQPPVLDEREVMERCAKVADYLRERWLNGAALAVIDRSEVNRKQCEDRATAANVIAGTIRKLGGPDDVA